MPLTDVLVYDYPKAQVIRWGGSNWPAVAAACTAAGIATCRVGDYIVVIIPQPGSAPVTNICSREQFIVLVDPARGPAATGDVIDRSTVRERYPGLLP